MVPPLPQTMPTTPVAMRAKPAFFCGVNASFKNGRREDGDHQRHHAGKEGARVCRGREQQTGIGKQDRGRAAEHKRRHAKPAEAVKRKPSRSR